MKFTQFVPCLKAVLIWGLICCFGLTVAAENYYPAEVGNTWVFLNVDGTEKHTYTLLSSENTEVEGLIALKITEEALKTEVSVTDTYLITVENDGGLLLHQSILDEGVFGIVGATFNPPIPFFPAELSLGHTWQIVVETEAKIVGPVTRTSTMEVVDIEDVETAAGVFKDCVKLKVDQKDVATLSVVRETSYQWLAPDIGPVKYLNSQDILYELQSYTLIEPGTLPVKAEKTADLNGDGVVNILDLVILANAFGKDSPDLNADGVVNILDLVIIANAFDG